MIWRLSCINFEMRDKSCDIASIECYYLVWYGLREWECSVLVVFSEIKGSGFGAPIFLIFDPKLATLATLLDHV